MEPFNAFDVHSMTVAVGRGVGGGVYTLCVYLTDGSDPVSVQLDPFHTPPYVPPPHHVSRAPHAHWLGRGERNQQTSIH